MNPNPAPPHASKAQSLEIPVDQLHPDWQGDWGKTILSPRNREALLNNPRLSSRISRDIIASISGGAINEKDVSPDDLAAYRVAIREPDRLRTLLGLANHSHMLFDMISGPQVRRLSEAIDIADLRLALGCRHLVPDTAQTRLAPERLAEAIESSGTRSLIEWSQSLPRPFATRLKLLLPKKSLFETARSSSDNHSLSRLVYHIAGELSRDS